MTTSLEIRRHQSDLGIWEYIGRAPHPRLRPYVRGYVGYVERATQPMRRVEIPSVDVPLIINLGASWDIHPSSQTSTNIYDSFVAGLHDACVLTEATGDTHGVQVDFTPLGASRFLGLPLGELTGLVVPLDDLLGDAADRLTADLRNARDWETRFAILDRAILNRLHAARPSSPALAWAWQQLERSAGQVTVADLAAELGWSRKHLSTQFRQQIGLPPKTIARILRFTRAVEQLARADRGRWGEIAYDCGYYDQAHLIRDFNDFAGCTPTDFAARILPGSVGIARE